MTDSLEFHENLGRQSEAKRGSDRAFGFVFAGFFLIVGLWPLIGGGVPRLWAIGLAVAFLAAALIRPALLGPLNRIWLRFGELLHRIVSPIVMGVVFYLTVTPIGILMRLLGKKPIPTDFDRDRQSYWIERDPPGPAPETMKNQF